MVGQRRRLPASVVVEIGQRDDWLCGICRDPSQPMTRPAVASAASVTPIDLDDLEVGEPIAPPPEWIQERASYDPLAASVDHIVPQKAGGSDDPSNLQIAHLACNLMKHDGESPTPAYAAARLRWRVQGTPVPARLWQREREGKLRRGSPAWRGRYELLDRECRRGKVKVEPWRMVLRYRVWRAHRRHIRRRRARVGEL